MLVVVAERGGRDAGAEIEESSPVFRPQPGALAPLESEVGAVVGGHQGGDHRSRSLGSGFTNRIAGPLFADRSQASGKCWRLPQAESNEASRRFAHACQRIGLLPA